MNSLLSNLPEDQQSKLEEKKFPDWMDPMLATLTEDYFDDENWIFERKLDGVRILVFKDGDDVTLLSRNKNKLNDTYPELVEALEKESDELFITDGEVVAFDGEVPVFHDYRDA